MARRYPPEMQDEALRLLRTSGKTVAELSRELGVPEQTLRSWRRRAAVEPDEGAGTGISDEARRRQAPLEVNRGSPDDRRLARLTADMIDLGVAVVTAPPKLAARALRWYADRGSERSATGSADRSRPGSRADSR